MIVSGHKIEKYRHDTTKLKLKWQKSDINTKNIITLKRYRKEVQRFFPAMSYTQFQSITPPRSQFYSKIPFQRVPRYESSI